MPALLIMLVGLLVLFTVWAILVKERFLTLNTLISTLDMLVVSSFLGIGAGCLLISGNIDFSASQIGAFAGVIIAVAIKSWALSWPLAILLTLAVSACIGLCNAVLVNEFRFQAFIATMAMASVVKGFMIFFSVDPKTGTAATVSFTSKALDFIGTYRIGGIFPFTILIMLACFIGYGLMLNKSKFGMNIYLVGGNPAAARLAGINPKFVRYILFANSAMLAGVSGIIYAARTKQGNLQALATSQFTGMTAAMLGGISFGGGAGGLGGAFVGLLILNTFTKGMTVIKFDAYWTTAFSGLLLLTALTVDYLNMQRTNKKLRA
jgi:ribose/xylose/arabinose/galactoside ABC-type transport system permease subunit